MFKAKNKKKQNFRATKQKQGQDTDTSAAGFVLTSRTRLGRLRSSSSVICVSYVGRSKTGGLSLTSLT